MKILLHKDMTKKCFSVFKSEVGAKLPKNLLDKHNRSCNPSEWVSLLGDKIGSLEEKGLYIKLEGF